MLKLYRRKGSPFWIARGTIAGRRIERSTKRSNKHDARALLPALIAEATIDQLGPDGLRFDQALAMYLDAHPAARFVEQLAGYFQTMPVAEITLTEMRRAANLLYPDAAAATVQRQLYTPVKAILNFAADEELCAPPRFRALKGISRKRTTFFLPAEAERMITALAAHRHRHFAVLATFLFGQGSRLGETLCLEWQDVSLGDRLAILRNTKSGQERRLHLVDRAIAALSTIRPADAAGRVFRRSDGGPFTTGTAAGGQIRSQWQAACTAAGIDAATHTPHVCRHSWATWFYAQTRDVLALKDAGGWASHEYQRYTKLATEELGASARAFGWNFEVVGENWGKRQKHAGLSNT